MSSAEKNCGCVEFRLVLPEEFAPVHDLAVAQVEQVERHQRRLGIRGEDVDIVALGRGHLLALVHFFHGGEQVAQRRRLFEARLLGGLLHALAQTGGQIRMPALRGTGARSCTARA